MNFVGAVEDMFDRCEDDDDSDEEEVDQIDFQSWKTFPQKKENTSLKSLKMLAIENICINIDFWMERISENSFKYLYIISPFDKLRSVDTLEILKKTIQMRKFQHRHLNLFFHQNLSEIDFGLLSKFNLTDVHLKTLLNRCKKIKRLKIPSRSNFSPTVISQIPSNYPNLEEIFLYTYALDHGFIKTLTNNCTSLKSLHLSGTSILDSTTCEELKLPKTITSLSLHGLEKITAKETWKIFSQLPKLSRLSLHQSTMKFATLDPITHRLPNIQALDLSACSLSDRAVLTMVTSIDNIVDLNLSNCIYLTSICFTYISRLQNIELLRMCHLNYLCEFDANVESCLVKIGHRLSLLDFSGLRKIKIEVIGHCCPNLLELHLNECVIAPFKWIRRLTSSKETEDLFSLSGSCQKLKTLCMGKIVCPNLDDDHLENVNKVFAGGNKIKHLKLSSDDLPVNFFKLLVKTFEWDDLEILDFSGNSRGVITIPVVVYALQRCPSLSRLIIRYCNLASSEKKQLLKMIDLSKIDISVDLVQ